MSEPTAISGDRLFREVRVAPDNAGMRVDVYLSARFRSWSRTAVVRSIRAGEVISVRRSLKPATLLEPGERLRIYTPGYAPDGPAPPLPPVIYEDDQLMVLNKPPGLLVHPAGDRFCWAVIGVARDARPEARLDLCHRLDRDTSGVLVLTKDTATNAAVKALLKHRHPELAKSYLAITRGCPEWDVQDVRAPLGDDVKSEVRLRRGVVTEGKAAHTTVTVVKRLGEHALVRCQLHTGRTHQIRIHLDHLGYPILGDRLYGQPDSVFLSWHHDGVTDGLRNAVGFPRHCLHAWRLQLPMPDGRLLSFEAPLPPDMQGLVDGQPPSWPRDGGPRG